MTQRELVGNLVLEAAGGKNVAAFSAGIGRQLLELGLIDEIDLQMDSILLGDGIGLYDNAGAAPIRPDRLCGPDPAAEVNVRYRPHRPRADMRPTT